MPLYLSSPTRNAARRRLLLSSVAAAILQHATAAQAQQATSADVTLDELSVHGEGLPADSSAPIQTLKRTTEAASRLGLSVKETPATVDVITQARMQEEGLRTLTEAYQAAPGVVAGNLPGEPGVTSIRGFSRGAVGYTVDGFRAIDPLLASRNYDTYSFDRIEVLKGPASVVNGSGSLAGTINIVTRQPVFNVNRSDALLSYGAFNTVRTGASFNAAPSPNVAASGSVLLGRSDGYVDDTDSRNVQLTTGLAVQVTDRLKVTAAVDYFKDDYSTPYQGTPLLPRGVARNPSGVVSAGDFVLDRSIRSRNYNVLDGVMKSDTVWVRTGIEYELTDNWLIRNDFAYYHADRYWANSEDYSFNAATGLLDRTTSLITHDHESWTNRTSAKYDGDLFGFRNRFTAGFEYMGTDFGSQRRFGTTTSVDPFAPVRGTFPTDPASFGTRQDFESKVGNAALFVEDAFNVTPGWIVVAGVRQDWIDLDRTVNDLNAGTTTRFGRSFEATSWRVGTVYDLVPGISLFGQYTTAVTPVGALLLSNMQRASFDLTTGQSMEAGVKSAFLDDRAVATVSVYQIEQDNILTRDPNNPVLTVQGGSQRSRGIEFDLLYAVTDQWKVNANAAFLKAEFTKLLENGVSRAGNRPFNVPEQTFNLWSTYRLASLPLTFGMGIRYVGDFFTDNANSIRVSGRAVLDASIAYDVPVGGTLVLRGRNLTDEFYGEWSGYSATQIYVGAPRAFDVTYSVKF